MGQPRPASPDFSQPRDGRASKADVGCSFGPPVRHPGHASPTQEDDYEDSGEDDVLETVTRALEHGQIHRPEAAVAAKAPLVDLHQTQMDGWTRELASYDRRPFSHHFFSPSFTKIYRA
jgi:hypothetical protein